MEGGADLKRVRTNKTKVCLKNDIQKKEHTNMNIYTIFDSKAKVYINHFDEETDEAAQRMFSQMANDPKSMICAHPADFTLFGIGGWDKYNGDIIPYENNQKNNLGLALDFKTNPPAMKQEDLFARQVSEAVHAQADLETEAANKRLRSIQGGE